MINKKYIIYVLVACLIVVLSIGAVKLFYKGSAGILNKAEVKKVLYHCPMHPAYISDKPGDCPICGMKLVPIEKNKGTKHAGHGADVAGQGEVTMTPEQEQLIGVKVEIVKKRSLMLTIRAAGRVAHDPELYNAIVEYQRALKSYEEIKGKNVSDEIKKQIQELIDSSIFKLSHLGLSENQIKNLSKDKTSPENLLMADKAGGTVWVYAQIYEYEVGLVKEGQKAEVTAVSLPGKKFTGIIKAVNTYLDSETRTLKVRTEVSNAEGLLKPEMYVDVSIYINLGYKLAVPEEAVLDTGTRKLVFIRKGTGNYVPREIAAGYEADGYYEVISGLKEGEKVVASANFLIDSESKLKSAISDTDKQHNH